MEHIREPLKKYVVVQNQIWSVVLLYLVWFSLLPAWMGGMGNYALAAIKNVCSDSAERMQCRRGKWQRNRKVEDVFWAKNMHVSQNWARLCLKAVW